MVLRKLFYTTMRPLVAIYLRHAYGLRIQNNPLKQIKTSYLLIGHHVTDLDAVFVMVASHRLVRFLAGDANMDTPWKKKLFTFLGMVPFKKKRSDMQSIRQLMALVKADEAIGLYPEGGRSWDGATDDLIPSTAKLIKLLGIPVYTSFYKGGYLTRPRWSDYRRKGQIVFDAELLLRPDEIKTLSIEDLHNSLVTALNYNEFNWQKTKNIPFKGKNLAESIERLLYLCPECYEFNSLESHGNQFSCRHCGHVYQMNSYGFIENCRHFDNPHDWNLWQKKELPRILDLVNEFSIPEMKLQVTSTDTKDLIFEGFANLTIEARGLTLACKNTEFVPIEEAYGFSFTFMDFFEFYTTRRKYRLVFDPRKHLSNVFVLDLLTYIKEASKNER